MPRRGARFFAREAASIETLSRSFPAIAARLWILSLSGRLYHNATRPLKLQTDLQDTAAGAAESVPYLYHNRRCGQDACRIRRDWQARLSALGA